MNLGTLEIKAARRPSFQKGRRKRTDSGTWIKQATVAHRFLSEKGRHEASDWSWCEKLAELRLPFRIAGLGYDQPHLFNFRKQRFNSCGNCAQPRSMVARLESG